MVDKKKKTRSKNGKKPDGSQRKDRQAMSPPDWLARAPASPDGSLRADVVHPHRDIRHRAGEDDGRISANPVLSRKSGSESVDLGGEKLDLLPHTEGRISRIYTSDDHFKGSSDRNELVPFDGAYDEPGKRISTVYHPSVQAAATRPPSQVPQHGQANRTLHPDRASYLHQSLINRITERLRDEAGLSPDSIAELLKKGAHLLPPPPTTPQPDPLGAFQSSAERPSISGQLHTYDSLPSLEVAQSKDFVNSEAVTFPFSTANMSPGILIPRNAGIKLRGVEPEPPLVDAPAPDKSKIVVASQYLFQHDLEAAGMMDERDVQGRLQGIQVIEAGRRALRMPMKTYGTACVFFMRYRYHVATKGAEDDAASRYDFRDAALASLWLASKAEETPKKSKEILCAFRNTTLSPEEQLTPDDEIFENQAKLMINLERYLLEIVAFDFRARNGGELLAGLMVEMGSDEKVVKVAMAVALDLYRTLAVLKQTRQTLALACIEMASRFVQADTYVPADEVYTRVGTTRQEVLETLFDLIELYLNHHAITAAGSKYNINDFMRVSTTLRSEMKSKGYDRYTYMQEALPSSSPTTSPHHTDAKSTPTLMGTPRTPANRETERRKKTSPKENEKIMVEEKDIELGKPLSPPPAFLLSSPGRANGHGGTSPTSPTSPTSAEQTNPDDPSQVKEVVRFVLDAARARDEDLLRRPYHQISTVEVTEHHTLYIPKDGSSEQAEADLKTPAASSAAGKMRNGADTDMRNAPSAPSGPRGLPPMAPRGDRERDDRRDRDREAYRRRTPPPPSSRMYPRDDRYGRRDDRRW